MTGNPGIGKTHTAIGLGMKACEEGYRVLFVRIPDLLTELKESNDAKKLLIVYPSGQQKSQRS